MASLSRTVHMRTPEEVLQAYENWNCPQFSIINGKQLLFAYDDPDADLQNGMQLLQQWLEILNRSQSAGIYTLCIYRDLNSKRVTNTTPYNGSANFQLHEYSYNRINGPGQQLMDPTMKIMLDKMEAMQMELQRLQAAAEADDDDEPESGGDFIGQVTQLIQNPVIAGLIASLLPSGAGQAVKALQHHQAQQPTMQPVHGQGGGQGNGQVSRIAGTESQDPDELKLANAMAVLKQKVPNLPEVMHRLSIMAEKHPFQFKAYVSMLMAKKL